MSDVIKWVTENKALIGWLLGAVAAGLTAGGLTVPAQIVAAVAAFFMGGGHLTSDAEVRAKNGSGQ